MTTRGLSRRLRVGVFALMVAATACGEDSDTAAGASLEGRAFLSESVTEDGTT